MSRVSSIVFGTVVAGIVASVAGCQASVTVKTKTRFAETNVVKEDAADWGGGPIEIKIEGVGAALNGGVRVTADPSATKVKATARMLAMAFAEEKANADLSIEEAKATFAISNDGSGVKIVCGHGGKHGSSEAGESGCELVEIVVPAGTDAKKLQLKVLSGNGGQKLQLSQAVVSDVGANSANGDIEANLPATKDGTISLVTESGDITATMPSDWAADEVILQADSADQIKNSFADAKVGPGAGGRGTAGTGLKLLKLTSKSGIGDITLQ